MCLRVRPDEVTTVAAAPRPVSMKAWLRTAFIGTGGLLGVGLGGIVLLAASSRLESLGLGKIAVLALLGLVFLYAGGHALRDAFRYPQVYRHGVATPVDLVVRGRGPPFHLRITSGDPREDEQTITLEHSLLSGATYSVTASDRVDGTDHQLHHTLSVDDGLAAVEIDGRVGAGALVHPTRHDRAVLITRRIAVNRS